MRMDEVTREEKRAHCFGMRRWRRKEERDDSGDLWARGGGDEKEDTTDGGWMPGVHLIGIWSTAEWLLCYAG